jgi:hypothetical protein
MYIQSEKKSGWQNKKSIPKVNLSGCSFVSGSPFICSLYLQIVAFICSFTKQSNDGAFLYV